MGPRSAPSAAGAPKKFRSPQLQAATGSCAVNRERRQRVPNCLRVGNAQHRFRLKPNKWRGCASVQAGGACGARSGCLRAVGGLPPETDDRGSRRRASGLCAATVAGGLGAPYLAHMCTAMPARRTSTGGLRTADGARTHVLLALNSLHRMEQDYPLNLSISLSGGKETNRDGLSNGE